MKSNRDKYFNFSHFVRCAIIKLIKSEGVNNENQVQ